METPQRNLRSRGQASPFRKVAVEVLNSVREDSSHKRKGVFSSRRIDQNDKEIESPPHSGVGVQGNSDETPPTTPPKKLSRLMSKKRTRKSPAPHGEDVYQLRQSPRKQQRQNFIPEMENSPTRQDVMFSDDSGEGNSEYGKENLDASYPIPKKGHSTRVSGKFIGKEAEHRGGDASDDSTQDSEGQSTQEEQVEEIQAAIPDESVVQPPEDEVQPLNEKTTTAQGGEENQVPEETLGTTTGHVDVSNTKETAPTDSWGTNDGEDGIIEEEEGHDEDYEPSVTGENEDTTLVSDEDIDNERSQKDNMDLQVHEWNPGTDASEASAQASNLSDDATTDTDDELIDSDKFLDQSQVFEQEDNWKDLVSEARNLMKQVEGMKGMTSRSCKNLFGNISNIKDIYEENTNRRRQKDHEPVLLEMEEAGLRELDKRYEKVICDLKPLPDDYRRSKRARLRALIRDVERDIVPKMVGLLQACLVSHYADHELSKDGASQAIRLLDRLSNLCKHVHPDRHKPNLIILDTLKTTRILIRFMQYVFKAESSRIDEQHSTNDPIQLEPLSEKEDVLLTAAEADALINGLRKHKGESKQISAIQYHVSQQ